MPLSGRYINTAVQSDQSSVPMISDPNEMQLFPFRIVCVDPIAQGETATLTQWVEGSIVRLICYIVRDSNGYNVPLGLQDPATRTLIAFNGNKELQVVISATGVAWPANTIISGIFAVD